MSDEVTDTWLVGVVAHDDALSSVRVHAGYLAAGPTSGRDHRVGVRIRFGDAEAPGFPDSTTSEALLAAEERLVAAVGDGAVLVAVLTVPGSRNLIFHTATPEECRARLEDTATDLGDAAPGSGDGAGLGVVDVDTVADPAWSMYRSLFTDAVPADNDRRRIQDVTAASDGSDSEYRIEHRFSFPRLADADQAAAALRDAGLRVTFAEAAAADQSATDAPARFGVVESETLTQIDMARSRDALGGFAVSWGGDYLGWEVLDDTGVHRGSAPADDPVARTRRDPGRDGET